jgi:hypothetical protein
MCSGRPAMCCNAVEFLIHCNAAIDVCAPLLHLKWVPWRVTVSQLFFFFFEFYIKKQNKKKKGKEKKEK